jgi:hypothetical protein
MRPRRLLDLREEVAARGFCCSPTPGPGPSAGRSEHDGGLLAPRPTRPGGGECRRQQRTRGSDLVVPRARTSGPPPVREGEAPGENDPAAAAPDQVLELRELPGVIGRQGASPATPPGPRPPPAVRPRPGGAAAGLLSSCARPAETLPKVTATHVGARSLRSSVRREHPATRWAPEREPGVGEPAEPRGGDPQHPAGLDTHGRWRGRRRARPKGPEPARPLSGRAHPGHDHALPGGGRCRR